MKTVKYVMVLSLIIIFSSSGFAQCAIPDKLKNDIVVNDMISSLIGMKSFSGAVFKEKGVKNYDEYIYVTNSYSRALEHINSNINAFGEQYAEIVEGLAFDEKKEALVNQLMSKFMNECGEKAVTDELYTSIVVALSGDNKDIEFELTNINDQSLKLMGNRPMKQQ
ncbi:hypothetical protein [Aeromonas hydrophila]|uniref:hypothetical protein n=1 Tax=Aeromonas hydrophila TaxID=644 RepID=UPI003D7F7242